MCETSYTDTNSATGAAGKNVTDSGRIENIFGTSGQVHDYFIPKTYRTYQRETMGQIEDAFESGYRFVLVDAPTGSGKSHIARAFAFQAGSAHILTIQKLLQDQYERDFPDMFVMKGRSSYSCLLSDSGESCATGPCQRKKKEACPDCPYKLAKEEAVSAPVTVHNFDSFYYQNLMGGAFSGRKLLIVDEVHNSPAKFSDFLSFSIDSRAGLIIPEYSSLEEYDEFVSQAYSALEVEHSVLSDAHEAAGLNDFELKRMHDLGMTLRKMYRYMKSREGNKKAEYVFDYIPIGRWSPKVTFRPVFVGDYTQRHLFSYGERVLMMSATIISKEIFCQEVGINSSEVCYISVPSTFPVENRPIIKRYVGKMNYQSIDKTLPQIAEAIMDIGRKYPDRRGIVQTHSEKIAGYLQQHLDDPRFTFSKQYESPQAALDVHKEKQASILVASGLREGLDLQGELSKIQIFCKVPYPNLGDKLVKRKLEINEVWYGWITVVMFIQALGRSIRSPKEKAVTYILDSGFAYFYKKWGRFIPDYIKEAIKK